MEKEKKKKKKKSCIGASGDDATFSFCGESRALYGHRPWSLGNNWLRRSPKLNNLEKKEKEKQGTSPP